MRLTPKQIDHAPKLIDKGEARQNVAGLLNVGRSTCTRHYFWGRFLNSLQAISRKAGFASSCFSEIIVVYLLAAPPALAAMPFFQQGQDEQAETVPA
jgi:hypothetical protein